MGDQIMDNEILCSSKTLDGCEQCVTTLVLNHRFCQWLKDGLSGTNYCGFLPAAAEEMGERTDRCRTTPPAVIQGEEQEEDMRANAQIDAHDINNSNIDPLYRGRSSPKPKWKLILYEASQEIKSSSGGGKKVPTRLRDFEKPITMPPSGGTTLGIYVTLDSSDLKYTNGKELGRIYTQDKNIMLLEGTGVGHIPLYSNNRFFSPRVFNGDVRYTIREKIDDGGEEADLLAARMNAGGIEEDMDDDDDDSYANDDRHKNF